ncbi:hypothetical protein PoB_006743200 [Plakobranchus ocellatus]|uniref:Uncharacterized protein n=1 Tax=Plakobranchus ocellatus TaxID=259542 RepID=A0AAV4DA70_9GAST|nr:hypothetical protein PoB_006743200 [Plakobranchus ocellatus]
MAVLLVTTPELDPLRRTWGPKQDFFVGFCTIQPHLGDIKPEILSGKLAVFFSLSSSSFPSYYSFSLFAFFSIPSCSFFSLGGRVASESALKSAGRLLSRGRAPPPAS